MQKPSKMMVATAVFMAGLANGLVYTLGYLFLLVIQFVTKGGGGANFGSALTSLLVTLMFSTLLSCIITVVLALPIALVCRWFGWIGTRAFLIAPAVGAVTACAIASLLDVAPSTYAAIIAFAYISAAIIWISLGRPRADRSAAAILSAA